MMIKYRVSEVAKDFGKTTKEVVGILAEFDDAPKKSMTALEENELDLVFERLTQANQVENFDEYFAAGEKARKEEEKKKEAAKAARRGKSGRQSAREIPPRSPPPRRRARLLRKGPSRQGKRPPKSPGGECSCGRRSRAAPAQAARSAAAESAGGTADGRYPHPAGQCGK